MKMKMFTKRAVALLTAIALLLGLVFVPASNDTAEAADKLVIVLDPGHGGKDGGTVKSHNGLTYVEKNINLTIAQYCMAELQKYSNVEVYITRGGDYYAGLDDRIKYAADRGANVFVSIHCNSSDSSPAHGAEVYYPNQSLYSSIGTVGQGLSSSILGQLTSLGISNGGIHIRNSENGETYRNGQISDYYSVIRGAKKSGFVGIIVEHGYLSSSFDASHFFQTEAELKALGVADAIGIAKYYGLGKTVYNGVDYSRVYDPYYYLTANPDVAAAFGADTDAALAHFVNYGINEGRAASENFDVEYYRDNNPDLQAAFGDNLKSYYMHFINFGYSEGRKGCENYKYIYDGVDYSAVFDPVYYVENNPDLKAYYGSNRMASFEHFLTFGMKEGRQATADFNVFSYKNEYADLRAAFGDDLSAYYSHYMKYGREEGRDGTGYERNVVGFSPVYDGIDYSAVFDVNYYLQNNPDLTASFGYDCDKALWHFVTYGMKEGRQGNANFNVSVYRNNNGDVNAAFGDDLESYYLHFINYGQYEARTSI